MIKLLFYQNIFIARVITHAAYAFNNLRSVMIQRTLPTCQELDWQDELRQLITTPEALFERLCLPSRYLDQAHKAHALFPVRTTLSFINAMQKGDINDPLLKQVLPLGEELIQKKGFTDTPLEEDSFNTIPGIIHKYHGRVLLIAATQCAINCRYCFRRNFDYTANTLSKAQWQDIFNYINSDSSIEEVIFSGGDPLAMPDAPFAWAVTELEKIPHITRLRIHSRIPIVLPSRITKTLCHTLRNSRFDVAMVIHSNHAQEITPTVIEALNKLTSANIVLLNQSVLLKGINDNAATLTALSKALFSAGVMPYYLHLLDKVNGASHFDINKTQAKQLITALTESLSGYLVPKLVQEIPHAKSKTPIR